MDTTKIVTQNFKTVEFAKAAAGTSAQTT